MGRQKALKIAMLDSNVLKECLSGFKGTTKQTVDFQHWLVRQVEHRVDLAMDNRPAPWEIDWHYWAEWLCTYVALRRRVHVEAATAPLSNLPPELVGGSGSSSSSDGGYFEVGGYAVAFGSWQLWRRTRGEPLFLDLARSGRVGRRHMRVLRRRRLYDGVFVLALSWCAVRGPAATPAAAHQSRHQRRGDAVAVVDAQGAQEAHGRASAQDCSRR